jgi:hypothetical protein
MLLAGSEYANESPTVNEAPGSSDWVSVVVQGAIAATPLPAMSKVSAAGAAFEFTATITSLPLLGSK